MNKLIFISLLATCFATQAQVYSYTDQNGNTTYTDTVPEHEKDRARKLEIELTPSTPKTPATASDTSTAATDATSIDTAEPAEEGVRTLKLSPPSSERMSNSVIASDMPSNTPKTQDTAHNQSLTIKKPKEDETFVNTDQITIEVTSETRLAAGAAYRYLIDGKILKETSDNNLTVGSLERGAHQLEVQIVNANKEVIFTSEQVTFFIRQTTLADKRRVNPCLIREYGVRPECPLKDKPKPQPRNLLLRTTDAVGITRPANQ